MKLIIFYFVFAFVFSAERSFSSECGWLQQEANSKKSIPQTLLKWSSLPPSPGSPAQVKAQLYYSRLTGARLATTNPLFTQMVQLIEDNQSDKAILIAMSQPGFIEYSVRNWAALLLTNNTNPLLELNDSLALLLGSVRDNLDARQLLVGDFSYGRMPQLGNGRPPLTENGLYAQMDANSRSLSEILYLYEPQWDTSSALESSGILTTRWWASQHYKAGTNRVVIPHLMSAFFCYAGDSWKEANRPTDRIRQDIDRFPQGDARVFQTQCRSCHAIMDGFAGAFAKIDFEKDYLTWNKVIRPKFLQHSEMYPDGYVTKDTSWVNQYSKQKSQTVFGWHGSDTGDGILSLAKALTETDLFSECLALRTFNQMCGANYKISDPLIKAAALEFRSDNYKLKNLFVQALLNPTCLPEP